MTRLGFLVARTLRRESPLQRLSAGPGDLARALAGRSVALVGNSRALAKTRYGADIDRADIVIRINAAPMPSALSHGSRTDWLALAVRLRAADRARIGAGRYLWLSHKRKRLDYATATSPGFYLHPLGAHDDLARRLGARPSTGAMLIDLLAASPLSALDLYGFDFMASLSLSGSRDMRRVPHDFAAEARMVAALMAVDPRITLHG